MRRYRVFRMQFDSTASLLDEAHPEWDESVKALHERNRAALVARLVSQYGEHGFAEKLQNVRDLGPLEPSIIAFHNVLHEQARTAFIARAYYPALTAVCALGERILNQLFLVLRDDFKETLGYSLYGKRDSITNWPHLVAVLRSWNALLPDVADEFLRLESLRHRAVHYSPNMEANARELARNALQCMRVIVRQQFGVLGRRPWILGGVGGEMYVRKEAENQPFVRRLVLPNCLLVGPWHRLGDFENGAMPLIEHSPYPDREISDEEFCALRNGFNDSGQKSPGAR